jgi:hypothetical protein
MRLMSFFLVCQEVLSSMNLGECEDQIWFKVQAVPLFVMIEVRWFRVPCKMSWPTTRGTRTQFQDHCSRQSVHICC